MVQSFVRPAHHFKLIILSSGKQFLCEKEVKMWGAKSYLSQTLQTLSVEKNFMWSNFAPHDNVACHVDQRST